MTEGSPSPFDETGLRSGLARLLSAGTWVSCALLAAGLLLDAVPAWRHAGAPLLAAGVAALIALPSLRVAFLMGWFGLRREYGFAAIAAVVLAIIAVSTFVLSGGG